MRCASILPQWAARYPELGTDPLPVEPNTSPEYFERERARIFRHAWLNVGEELTRFLEPATTSSKTLRH
ncbi:MAG: hypothetical protein H0V18_10930 [Pyrinomonadaceae bacterium]|jgi:hypothetical protein|nr:hypothetical protein [Pyrinomonadaceae bacterium]